MSLRESMSDSIEIDGEKLSWSDFSEAFARVLEEEFAGGGGDEEQEAAVELVRSAFDLNVVLQMTRECMFGDEVDYFGLSRSNNSCDVVAFWISNSGASDVIPIKPEESLRAALDEFFDLNGWRLPQVSDTEIWNRRPDLLSKDEVRQLVVGIEKRGEGDFSWDSVGTGEVESTEEFMQRHYSE